MGLDLGANGKIKKFFRKERTFHHVHNMLFAYLGYLLKIPVLSSYPIKLTIDPANYCNLRCVLCPTGTKTKGRIQAFMPFETFQKIIDEIGKYLWEIDLFNWGEPFLNKDIFRMAKYSWEKNVPVNVSSNLNILNEDMSEQLIKSKINKLIISLDGASQESTEQYQKGTNFNSVIKNIRLINTMKKKMNSNSPLLHWRFLVNKYNEKELEKAEKMAKALNIDILEISQLRCDMGRELFLSQTEQYENVSEWLPKDESLSFYDYSRKQRKKIRGHCRLLWLESVIHPDGSISPCCAIWPQKFDFGNINNCSFKEIWNNENYQQARKVFKGEFSNKKNVCYICKKNSAYI